MFFNISQNDLPYIIDKSGTYHFAENLIYSPDIPNTNAITINLISECNIKIDFNGFTLDQGNSQPNTNGIYGTMYEKYHFNCGHPESFTGSNIILLNQKGKNICNSKGKFDKLNRKLKCRTNSYEKMTEITQDNLPYLITEPGVYYLNGDLIYNPKIPNTNAITIDCNDVIIDLNDYILKQDNDTPDTIGINTTKNLDDVREKNLTGIKITDGAVNFFTHTNIMMRYVSSPKIRNMELILRHSENENPYVINNNL
jgi:hypothetical protein